MNNADKEALADRLGLEAANEATIDGLPGIIGTLSHDVNMIRMDMSELKTVVEVELKQVRTEIESVQPLSIFYGNSLFFVLTILLTALVTSYIKDRPKKHKQNQPSLS